MRVYLDTSVIVAAITGEATASAIRQWRLTHSPIQVTADWTLTEVASALAFKVRTRQLEQSQADAAWSVFNRLTDTGALRLLPVSRDDYHQAANLVRTLDTGLRAADALHLAIAQAAKVHGFATLDRTQRASATLVGLNLVDFAG